MGHFLQSAQTLRIQVKEGSRSRALGARRGACLPCWALQQAELAGAEFSKGKVLLELNSFTSSSNLGLLHFTRLN